MINKKENSFIKMEVHTHTKYSEDCFLNKYFYLLMLKLKKISIIAITDHNEIKGANEFKAFLKKFNVKVIIGEEILTCDGEIIGLFLFEKIASNLSPKETIKKIKEQNGIVYIPHPYDEKRCKTVLKIKHIEENLENIDIIECHNGRNIDKSFSEEQEKIANRMKKYKLIGSDSHIFFELGRNYNIIKDFNNKEEFLKNLETVRFNKKKCILISHKITKVIKLIKLIQKGKFNEIFRIIKKKYSR